MPACSECGYNCSSSVRFCPGCGCKRSDSAGGGVRKPPPPPGKSTVALSPALSVLLVAKKSAAPPPSSAPTASLSSVPNLSFESTGMSPPSSAVTPLGKSSVALSPIKLAKPTPSNAAILARLSPPSLEASSKPSVPKISSLIKPSYLPFHKASTVSPTSISSLPTVSPRLTISTSTSSTLSSAPLTASGTKTDRIGDGVGELAGPERLGHELQILSVAPSKPFRKIEREKSVMLEPPSAVLTSHMSHLEEEDEEDGIGELAGPERLGHELQILSVAPSKPFRKIGREKSVMLEPPSAVLTSHMSHLEEEDEEDGIGELAGPERLGHELQILSVAPSKPFRKIEREKSVMLEPPSAVLTSHMSHLEEEDEEDGIGELAGPERLGHELQILSVAPSKPFRKIEREKSVMLEPPSAVLTSHMSHLEEEDEEDGIGELAGPERLGHELQILSVAPSKPFRKIGREKSVMLEPSRSYNPTAERTRLAQLAQQSAEQEKIKWNTTLRAKSLEVQARETREKEKKDRLEKERDDKEEKDIEEREKTKMDIQEKERQVKENDRKEREENERKDREENERKDREENERKKRKENERKEKEENERKEREENERKEREENERKEREENERKEREENERKEREENERKKREENERKKREENERKKREENERKEREENERKERENKERQEREENERKKKEENDRKEREENAREEREDEERQEREGKEKKESEEKEEQLRKEKGIKKKEEERQSREVNYRIEQERKENEKKVREDKEREKEKDEIERENGIRNTEDKQETEREQRYPTENEAEQEESEKDEKERVQERALIIKAQLLAANKEREKKEFHRQHKTQASELFADIRARKLRLRVLEKLGKEMDQRETERLIRVQSGLAELEGGDCIQENEELLEDAEEHYQEDHEATTSIADEIEEWAARKEKARQCLKEPGLTAENKLWLQKTFALCREKLQELVEEQISTIGAEQTQTTSPRQNERPEPPSMAGFIIKERTFPNIKWQKRYVEVGLGSLSYRDDNKSRAVKSVSLEGAVVEKLTSFAFLDEARYTRFRLQVDTRSFELAAPEATVSRWVRVVQANIRYAAKEEFVPGQLVFAPGPNGALLEATFVAQEGELGIISIGTESSRVLMTSLTVREEADNGHSFKPVLEGPLMKRGAMNKQFHKRWFRLFATELCYYKAEIDKKPAGTIALDQAVLETDSTSSLAFTLTSRSTSLGNSISRDRTYFLLASSETVKESWVVAIKPLLGREGEQVHLEGLLFKKGSLNTKEQSRLFRLVSRGPCSLLEYYKEKDSKSQGHIVISSSAVCVLTGPISFSIRESDKSRVYQLSAQSEALREEWMANIKLLIGTPLEPTSEGTLYKYETISGYLSKKGDRNKAFKNRFFHLSGFGNAWTLCYSKNEREKKMLGTITITATTKVVEGELLTFSVTPAGERQYVLSAPSLEMRASWLAILQRIISACTPLALGWSQALQVLYPLDKLTIKELGSILEEAGFDSDGDKDLLIARVKAVQAGLKPTPFRVGVQCFAPWDDGNYYHCTILSRQGGLIGVRFDEYGDTAEVTEDLLRL